jgi:hypothetical protein
MEKAGTESEYENQIPVEMIKQRKTRENVCLRIIFIPVVDAISTKITIAESESHELSHK